MNIVRTIKSPCSNTPMDKYSKEETISRIIKLSEGLTGILV